MKRIVFALGLLVLVGCAGYQSPAQVSVAAVEVGLTDAERLAYDYATLPRCGAPAADVVVCSDQKVVDQIKAADRVAYKAVKDAEAGAASVDAAKSALQVLQALLSAVPHRGA